MRYRRLSEETNSHIARSNELMADIRHEIALTREAMRDNRDAVHANRDAIREGAELVATVAREVAEALRDLRHQSQAQTEAIFTLIDRLGGGGIRPAP